MQTLSSRVTQSVNRLRERDGPLFKGRFRSIAIKDDAHLLRVIPSIETLDSCCRRAIPLCAGL
jgi:hypothetical protein